MVSQGENAEDLKVHSYAPGLPHQPRKGSTANMTEQITAPKQAMMTPNREMFLWTHPRIYPCQHHVGRKGKSDQASGNATNLEKTKGKITTGMKTSGMSKPHGPHKRYTTKKGHCMLMCQMEARVTYHKTPNPRSARPGGRLLLEDSRETARRLTAQDFRV